MFRKISPLFMGAALTLAVTFHNPSTLRGEDWPRWMGQSGGGVYRESGIVAEVPSAGLPIKWRAKIAGGYAGPAVAEGRVFVFDYLKQGGEAFNDPGKRADLSGQERLTAFDAGTGELLWRHSYDCPYSISYPAGPRCTPTVDGDHVYILGSEGDFRCLRAASGDLVWKRNFKEDFSAEVPIWGFASHPLVDGDFVYTMVGGRGQGIVAFDKRTGETRWQALDTPAGYCPPSIIEAGGTRQLIVFHPSAVESLNPDDGSRYWSIPISPAYEMSVTQPVVSGNRMYVSAIQTEALMIELASDSPQAKELWRGEAKNAVHCSNSTPAFVDGVIYGTDCISGALIAVDANNGDRLWETFAATKPDETRFVRHGTAFITRIGSTDRYLLMSETGDLIIATLTADGYHEHGRFRAVEPTGEAFGRDVVWSHPAYADRTAFIRNDEEVVAVDLSVQ